MHTHLVAITIWNRTTNDEGKAGDGFDCFCILTASAQTLEQLARLPELQERFGIERRTMTETQSMASTIEETRLLVRNLFLAIILGGGLEHFLLDTDWLHMVWVGVQWGQFGCMFVCLSVCPYISLSLATSLSICPVVPWSLGRWSVCSEVVCSG
jgi:hypothetical protein